MSLRPWRDAQGKFLRFTTGDSSDQRKEPTKWNSHIDTRGDIFCINGNDIPIRVLRMLDVEGPDHLRNANPHALGTHILPRTRPAW